MTDDQHLQAEPTEEQITEAAARKAALEAKLREYVARYADIEVADTSAMACMRWAVEEIDSWRGISQHSATVLVTRQREITNQRIELEHVWKLVQDVDKAIAPLCPCDTNPETSNGPERECPMHGDPPYVALLLAKVDAAKLVYRAHLSEKAAQATADSALAAIDAEPIEEAEPDYDLIEQSIPRRMDDDEEGEL